MKAVFKLFCMLATTSLAVQPLHAEPYALIAGDSRGIVVADVNTTKLDSDHVSIWEIQIFKEPKLVSGEQVSVLKVQIDIDCKRNSLQRVFSIGQTESGQYGKGVHLSERSLPIVPETHFVDIARIACSGTNDTDVLFDDIEQGRQTMEAVDASKKTSE